MKESLIHRAIRKMARKGLQIFDRFRIKTEEFVIISNNCWGAEIYKHLGRPYNTPFVGLYLYPECYLKLLYHWESYIKEPLSFAPDNISKYSAVPFSFPIGLLDDVEIHFMHYKDEEEAREKWERRKARMLAISDKNRFYVKLCDKLGCDSAMMNVFHASPWKNKLSFTAYSFPEPGNIQLRSEHLEEGEAPSGITLYRLTHSYMDLILWLNSGKVNTSLPHSIYRKFVI